MRICWINPEFLDYRIPVYQCLYKLCEKEFYIVFSQKTTPASVAEKTKNKLGRNAIPLCNDRKIAIGSQHTNLANSYVSLRYPKDLRKTIAEINPDILICEGFFKWSPYALFQAQKMNIPAFIVYERTLHTERNCPTWRKMARKILSPWITGFIINGKLTREYLHEIGYGNKMMVEGCMSADSHLLADKASVLTEEEKMILRRKWDVNQCGLVYLYVGQMVERKGVSFLLSAWLKHIEHYSSDRLVLVGEGILLDSFREKYSDYSSVIFEGRVNYDTIYQYYASVDVLVIPTLEDNWSLVVPEAMACNLPIATSIYNGCYPELIREDVNGYTFNPQVQQSIVDILGKFHSKDLKKMGMEGACIEKDYTPERVAQRIFNFCKR